MEFKNLSIAMSDDDELGVFRGWASLYDVVDSYNEIVVSGAFTKTLQESNGVYPLCWFHDIQEPLGITIAQDDQEGLLIEGHLNLAVKSAREKYGLMKQGAVRGLSIGFKTIKDEWDDNVRILKEIKLYETSLLPMNMQACPGAEITDVKQKSSLELLDLYRLGVDEAGRRHRASMREKRVLEALEALKAEEAKEALKAKEAKERYFRCIRNKHAELYGGWR